MTVFTQHLVTAPYPQELESAPRREVLFRKCEDPNVVCHTCSTDRRIFPGPFWYYKGKPLCRYCYNHTKHCWDEKKKRSKD